MRTILPRFRTHYVLSRKLFSMTELVNTHVENKKLKTSQKLKTVGTHDGKVTFCFVLVKRTQGTFHCDEALACFMLTKLTNEFRDAGFSTVFLPVSYNPRYHSDKRSKNFVTS